MDWASGIGVVSRDKLNLCAVGIIVCLSKPVWPVMSVECTSDQKWTSDRNKLCNTTRYCQCLETNWPVWKQSAYFWLLWGVYCHVSPPYGGVLFWYWLCRLAVWWQHCCTVVMPAFGTYMVSAVPVFAEQDTNLYLSIYLSVCLSVWIDRWTNELIN